MATASEDTLQIKNFLGVNRRIKGTSRDPRYFETLKNVEVQDIGSLKSIGGVRNLGGAGLTGVVNSGYTVEPGGGIPAGTYRIVTAYYDATTFALAKVTQNDPLAFDALDKFTGTTPSDPNYVYKVFMSEAGATATDELYQAPETTYVFGFIPNSTPYEFLTTPNYTTDPTFPNIIPAVDETIYFPGVDDFVHSQFLENSTGRAYLFFYKPKILTIPDPNMDSITFTQVGGAGATRNVKVTFVGPAGFRSVATRSVVLGATHTTATCPVNVPDYVFCVNFYVQTNPAGSWSDGYVWVGSFSRVAGEFATTPLVIHQPVEGSTANTTHYVTFANFDIEPLSGSIPEGTTVIVGATSHTGIAGKRIQIADLSGRAIAYTIPPGYGGLRVKLNTLTNAVAVNGPNPVATHFVPFVGTEYGLSPLQLIDGRTNILPNASAASGISITTLPQNSSVVASWVDVEYDSATKLYDFKSYVASAVAAQQQWTVMDYQDSSANGALVADQPQDNYIAGMAFPESAYDGEKFDQTKRRELLPHRDVLSLDISSLEDVTASSMVPQTDAVPTVGRFRDGALWSNQKSDFFGYRMDSRSFRDSVFMCNGLNQLWESNSFVWKPRSFYFGSAPTDVQPIPITAFIEVFKNKLILGGGPGNWANNPSSVYFSNDAQPSVYAIGSTIDVQFADASPINGFGLLSQNLSTAGPSSYLLVSKVNSIITWNGLLSTNSLVAEMDKEVGFAGFRSFTLTDHGPMFVGQDNIYWIKSFSDIDHVGYELAEIIEGLTTKQKAMIEVQWHKNALKISYPSADGQTFNNREIWYRFEDTSDGSMKWVSGPHEMIDSTTQMVVPIGTERSARISASGFNSVKSIFLRDDSSISTNDGAAQSREIVISNLGLNRDHFEKLLKRGYLAVETAGSETFTMTLTTEDGASGSLVLTFTAGAGKNLLQKQATSRFSGRVEKIVLTNTSTNPISLFDISLLYESFRRRIVR
jgi:hypothetical protein